MAHINIRIQIHLEGLLLLSCITKRLNIKLDNTNE